MKKILFALALLLTIGAVDAMAQSNPPLSNKRIRMKGQAAAPTPDPPTGYYNLWVDSGSGNLYITNSAGTDTPVGAGISGLTDNVIPQANGTTAIENSKMTASGTNSGTWTLYDDTAVTGSTKLRIRRGAGQSGAEFLVDEAGGAGNLFEVNGYGVTIGTAGTGIVFQGNTGEVTLGSTGFLQAWSYANFTVTNPNLKWPNATPNVGLNYSAAGILKVTDGSTGQGGIGISDSAETAVSDALILRHATSGTAAASFGTGLLFQGEDAAGNMQDMASIDAVYTDATNGSEDTRFVLHTTVAGADVEALVLSQDRVAGNTLTLDAADSVTNLNFATGGTIRWYVRGNGVGNLYPNADKTYDFGHPSLQIKDSYLSTSIQGTRTQAITDNAAAATFVTIAVPTSDTTVGGRIFYTITAIDAGTAIQTKTGTYSFGLNNIGGTVTGAGTDVLEHSQLSVGTLAPTFSVNISGTNAQFQLVLDTSLDAGAETLKIEYRVQIDSGTATVTPAT